MNVLSWVTRSMAGSPPRLAAVAMACLALGSWALPATAAPVSAAACDATPPPLDGLPDARRIVLHAPAGAQADAAVTVGIPFAPGVLHDARRVRIMDTAGREVPAAITPTLTWFFKDHSIRAVRAQFHATLNAATTIYHFAITSEPGACATPPWPYAEGLVAGTAGTRMPAVVATLSPQWMTTSLIAGPQQAAAPHEAYANYVARQFQWAAPLPVKDSTAWLFDRPTSLFKAYVRTGRADYLRAAIESYHFYMRFIKRSGQPASPECAGGWTYNDKPCDVKYVYIEPILLALALTGDDSMHDRHTIGLMTRLWANGGWNPPAGPYRTPNQYFTERLAGLGLVETVSAYELTGDAIYRKMIDDRIGWLYAHQRANPDGLGNDGSWRNSWNVHENDAGDPKGDNRGSSPWMSENIVDGLWHAWLVTGDARIPPMIEGFGQYLERYGWIPTSLLTNPHDWRHGCTGPDGQIAWYWSSAHAPVTALEKIQNSDGWYSDAHDVELAFTVAAARYFEPDPKRAKALQQRFEKLQTAYNESCAAIGDTLRRFNWNNRGSGVAQWLIRQPAGSGLRASPEPVQP